MIAHARHHQDSPHTCNTEDGSSSPLQLFYSSPGCSTRGSETLLRAESVAKHTHACDIALSYNAHHRKPTQLTHLPTSTTYVARHNHFTTGAAFWCIFTVTEENTHLSEGTTHTYRGVIIHTTTAHHTPNNSTLTASYVSPMLSKGTHTQGEIRYSTPQDARKALIIVKG